MADSSPSIGSRIASGATWMVALKSLGNFLGFFSTLILARLLVPADFGIVALAMATLGSLSVFSEFSFDKALIANQSAGYDHYNTTWTLGLIRGGLLSILLLVLAKPASVIFNDERMTGLLSVIALVPLMEGFVNVGVVEFRKQLAFRSEFILRFSARMAGVLTTIPLAFLWQSYWALVVGQLVAAATRLILSYALHPYRPRLSLTAWRDLFHFSKWLFMSGIILTLTQRAPIFLIAAFLNPASVGVFKLSKEITEMVTQSLVTPVQGTIFPGFSKVSKDMAILRTLFLQVYGLVNAISLPLMVGVAMTADRIVPLLLGENWLGTIPVIQILMIGSIARSLQGMVRPFLLAVNRPSLVTLFVFIDAILLIPLLAFGLSTSGLVGAAWAIVAVRVIMTPVRYFALHRLFQISLTGLVSRIWRSVLSCGVLALTVSMLKQELTMTAVTSSNLEQILQLSLIVVAGGCAYISSHLLLWQVSGRPADSAEETFMKFCKHKLFGNKYSDSGTAA